MFFISYFSFTTLPYLINYRRKRQNSTLHIIFYIAVLKVTYIIFLKMPFIVVIGNLMIILFIMHKIA